MSEDEAKLVWKLDLRILPLVTALYLVGFLNRVNIANIHTQINESLNISESNYGILVSAFFVGYTLFEVPSNLSLKKYGAHLWLSFLCLCWGICSFVSAFSPNFATLLTFRLLIGSLQAGIFPGILFYLSHWYAKSERGLRFSIFFVASLIASSLAGLLAYALLQMDNFLKLEGWRWLVLIEAVPSLIFAPFLFLLLPKSPLHATWLSSDMKQLAINRLRYQDSHVEDSIVSPLTDEEEILIHGNRDETSALPEDTAKSEYKEDESSTWQEFKNPIIWIFSIMYLCIGSSVSALSAFLPRIIELLGIDSVLSNLITFPLYLIAAIVVLIFSRNSDKTQERAIHLSLSCFVSVIGFLGLALIQKDTSIWVAFTFTQLAIIGCNASIPIACVWLAGVVPAERPHLLAVSTATMITFGQISGLVTPVLYGYFAKHNWNGSQKTEENYAFAHGVIAALMSVASFCALLLRYLLLSKKYFEHAGLSEERKKLLAIDDLHGKQEE